MSDWINDTMRKPAITAVSALLAVTAMGGHLPGLIAGDDTDRIKTVVREVIRSEYEARTENLEPLPQFIHRIDSEHRDCLASLQAKEGVGLVDAELVCSLRLLEDVAIRGLQ